MTAEVRSDHVVLMPKVKSHPVPIAAMISAAVNQEHKRLLGVAPIYVVKFEALGIKVV